MVKILYILLLLAMFDCQSDTQSSLDERTSWLYKADPTEDFNEAVAQEDYRFMGVFRYSLVVPGVPRECIDITEDVKPIEGTSDASSGYEEEKFNAVAMVYADYYNFQLRKYLEKSGDFLCTAE